MDATTKEVANRMMHFASGKVDVNTFFKGKNLPTSCGRLQLSACRQEIL